MANDISKVTPQLLAQGLLALRESAPMAMIVNRAYDEMAGPQGSTIDVPIPTNVAARDVTPGITAPAAQDVGPTSVPIELTQWKEADFTLTDKEQLEVQNGTLPMLASTRVRSLGNILNEDLLGEAAKFYGRVEPESGSVPFGDGTTKDASAARTVLNKQVAPMDPRYFIMDPDAEGSALNVRAFQDASFGVGGEAILEGQIFRRLGFGWIMSQLVQSRTSGTGAGYLVNSGSLAIGDKTIAADTGTGTILVGDIVTFAGHDQTYVVTSALSGGSFAIEPGLVVAPADNAAITVDDAGNEQVLNLAMHRDAIALATRPLSGSSHPNAVVDTQIDPGSGLALRVEYSREHRQDRWAWDILYGFNTIRRELGCRVHG